MVKLPKTKKEFTDMFGDGFKYPIKLDAETGWAFYNDLTAKQKESCIEAVSIETKALTKGTINDICVDIARIDKTHLPIILESKASKVKLINTLKSDENYIHLFDKTILKRLAINLKNKDKETKTGTKFDTGGAGELIRVNCTLKILKPKAK